MERGGRRRRPERGSHARRDGTPRLGAHREGVRPAGLAPVRGALPRVRRANRHRLPSLVAGARRARPGGARRALAAPRARPRRARAHGPGHRVLHGDRTQPLRPRRQRQPQRRGGAGGRGRDAPAPSAHRPEGAARVVRGRGGVPGRGDSLRGGASAGPGSPAHLGPEPRLGRLTEPGDAGGRGPGGDGGLLRALIPRPRGRGGRTGRRAAAAGDAGPRQHRLRDPQPRRLPHRRASHRWTGTS